MYKALIFAALIALSYAAPYQGMWWSEKKKNKWLNLKRSVMCVKIDCGQ